MTKCMQILTDSSEEAFPTADIWAESKTLDLEFH